MQSAYVGESFELEFRFVDSKDTSRPVEAVTFRVVGPDGSVVQAGAMSIKEDGHSASFRFNAEAVGMNTVEVSWSMGQDRWIQPHLMEVRALP